MANRAGVGLVVNCEESPETGLMEFIDEGSKLGDDTSAGAKHDDGSGKFFDWG